MPSLFARDIQVVVLSSGSAGNCTYVGDGQAGVLIDCGVSTRQIMNRMASVGLERAPIDAVLITHEHSDHVGAARVLADHLRKKRERPVPFFMTRGTADALPPQCRPDGVETIEPGKAFKVRHFDVEAFTVPHDTADPVVWRLRIGGTAVGVVTDLGRPTSLVETLLKTLSVAVLEFNHDVDLLMHGSYPWPTKQRIRGNQGHLSNDQAGDLLTRGCGEGLRHVILAHLSKENNRPEKALSSAARALTEAGADGRAALHVARQDEALPPVRVRADLW